MKLAATLALFALFSAECQNIDQTVPSPPPLAPEVANTDLCGQMCDHLAKLGCEEGKPVYNNDLPGPPNVPNQSCKDNCKELQTKGIPLNPKCLRTVGQCDQIEVYRQKDPNGCK